MIHNGAVHMSKTTDLLTRDEAAEYLRVTRSYLAHAGEAGPPYVQIGRLIRYRLADIQHWLAQHTITPAAAAVLD